MAGVDRKTLKRYSAYGFNAAWRRSVANEIYFFRPKTDDVDRLIRITEVIIHRYVTRGPMSTNVSWLSRVQGLKKESPSDPCRHSDSGRYRTIGVAAEQLQRPWLGDASRSSGHSPAPGLQS